MKKTKLEKEPRWFQFWLKTNKKQLEAITKVAEALLELQQMQDEGQKKLREIVSNPARLGELMSQAMAGMRQPPMAFPGVMPVTPALLQTAEGLPMPSPEEIQKSVDVVTSAVLKKMDEMGKHVATAIHELSPWAIKKIAEKIEAGEEFTLRRRHGCIHIDFGYDDEEFYLKL